MARTSLVGYHRQYGGPSKRNGTPAVLPAVIQMTIPASTTPSENSGKSLPNGSIPIFVQSVDGAGSAAGICNLGTSGTFDAFGSSLAVDVAGPLIHGADATGGASLGQPLTADTPIFFETDSTNDVVVAIYYIMADDGKEGS